MKHGLPAKHASSANPQAGKPALPAADALNTYQGRGDLRARRSFIHSCLRVLGTFQSPVLTSETLAELESSANPQAGKPAPPAADALNRYQVGRDLRARRSFIHSRHSRVSRAKLCRVSSVAK